MKELLLYLSFLLSCTYHIIVQIKYISPSITFRVKFTSEWKILKEGW